MASSDDFVSWSNLNMDDILVDYAYDEFIAVIHDNLKIFSLFSPKPEIEIRHARVTHIVQGCKRKYITIFLASYPVSNISPRFNYEFYDIHEAVKHTKFLLIFIFFSHIAK